MNRGQQLAPESGPYGTGGEQRRTPAQAGGARDCLFRVARTAQMCGEVFHAMKRLEEQQKKLNLFCEPGTSMGDIERLSL